MLLLRAQTRVRIPGPRRTAALVRGLAGRSASLLQEAAAAAPPATPPPPAALVPYSSRTEAPDESGVPASDPRVAARQREFLVSQLPARIVAGQRAARVAAVAAEHRALEASYVGALAHTLLVREDITAQDIANPWRWAHQVYPDALPPPPGAAKPSAAQIAHGARVAADAALAARRFRAVDSDGSDSEVAAAAGESSGSEAEEERTLSDLLEEAGPTIDAIGRELNELEGVETRVRGERCVGGGLVSLPRLPPASPQPGDLLGLHEKASREHDEAVRAAGGAAAAEPGASENADYLPPPTLVAGGLLPGVHFEGAAPSQVRRGGRWDGGGEGEGRW